MADRFFLVGCSSDTDTYTPRHTGLKRTRYDMLDISTRQRKNQTLTAENVGQLHGAKITNLQTENTERYECQ